MGRKHKSRHNEYDHIKKKIRRLEKKLFQYEYNNTSSSTFEDHHYERSVYPESDHGPPYPSSWEESEDERIRSIVSKPNLPAPTDQAANKSDDVGINSNSAPTSVEPVPSTSRVVTNTVANTAPAPLLPQILEALGDPKEKDEPFGPRIQDEICKRWDRVFIDGLSKEQRQTLYEKFIFPENLRLAKAPLLNPEIDPVLSDPVRNRDKLLEKSQNVLGRGISGLANLTSSLIDNSMDNVEIIRRLSEISQVFLDLHYDNTKSRRKLIITSLDKKFASMISDVKRDDFLFGSNLGEKIKASKTAERSGLQVRRQDPGPSKRQTYQHSGNWKGPLRHQGSSKPRRGGPKNRYWSQTTTRRPPFVERPAEPSKPGPKYRKPQ